MCAWLCLNVARLFDFFSLLPFLLCCPNQATFEEKRANVYDVAPKVRIMGSGFDSLDASTLTLAFAPALTVEDDYSIEISSSTTMVLTLKPDKK